MQVNANAAMFEYEIHRAESRDTSSSYGYPDAYSCSRRDIYAERENVLDGATNKVWLHVNIFYWPHSSPMVPVDYP